MDRLLRAAFAGLIRTGNSAGHDVRGDRRLPWATAPARRSRSASPRAAERGVLLDPELKFGEAYMDGTLVVEQGSIADVLAIVLGQHGDGKPPPGRALQGVLLRYLSPLQQFNPRRGRGATSRTTTISTASSTRCSSTPTGNTAAPISRRRTSRSTTPSSPRSATSRPSFCSTGPARARHRLRLGRAGALSGRALRRPRHRHHPLAGAARARARRAAEKGCPTRSSSVCRTTATSRTSSTASSRSACSSMSASASTTRSSANAPTLLDDDGVMLLHSIGRSEGPKRHQSVDREIHLSRRLHSGPVRGAAGDRARRACSSPTSRSCACTMPRRSRPGASASSPTATRSSGSTTSASCGCGSSTSRASEMAFREQAMMVFQLQLTKRQGVVPMTRDYIARERRGCARSKAASRPPLRLAGE